MATIYVGKMARVRYKITNDVPPPRVGREYPFEDMRPGENFFIPVSVLIERVVIRNRVASAASNYVRRNNLRGKVRFATRIENNGVRVWRIY